MNASNTLKKWLKIIALILVTLVLIEMIFAPVSLFFNVIRVNRIRHKLPIARTLWESHEVSDYQIDIKGFVPLLCIYNGTLEVRNGKPSSITSYEPLTDNNETIMSTNAWDNDRCEIADLVIPRMFEKVEMDLNSIDVMETELKVSFDAEYGFITRYENNYGYRRGVFNPVVGECCVWYAFEDFRPLFPETKD